MNIKNLELTVPNRENPFGRILLEIELPFVYKEGVSYPAEAEAADVKLSDKSIELLNQVRDSMLEDISNGK